MDIEKLEKGISLGFFGKISNEILESIQKNNFDCIEMSFSLDYYKEIDFIHQSQKYKEMIDKYNIKIWSLHLPFGKDIDISSLDDGTRKYAVDLYTQLVKSANKIGIETIVIHPSFEPIPDENREERIQNCKRSLEQLGQIAEKLKIRLAVENLPRTCLGNTSTELITIIKNIRGLGICFDSNHSLKEDNIKFLANIIGNKIPIYTIHLSDYDFVNERHRLPGDGINNWKEIIDILENIDYKGPVMHEITRKPLERDEITLEQIRINQEELVHRKI